VSSIFCLFSFFSATSHQPADSKNLSDRQAKNSDLFLFFARSFLLSHALIAFSAKKSCQSSKAAAGFFLN